MIRSSCVLCTPSPFSHTVDSNYCTEGQNKKKRELKKTLPTDLPILSYYYCLFLTAVKYCVFTIEKNILKSANDSLKRDKKGGRLRVLQGASAHKETREKVGK